MLQVQSPFQQLCDLSGKPLENGSIYIGAVNLNPETNPIAVYWDDAGTQPAAQPLRTLNGIIVRNGTPARVYTLQEDYSMTVRDKRRNIVFTVAEATSLSNLRIDLTSPSGSSIVTYLPDGVGGIPIPVQSKLREIISVLDYGADPTGVLSSVAAVRDAITWARLKAGNTTSIRQGAKTIQIKFPPGFYLIDETVLVPLNMEFIGDGATIYTSDTMPGFETGYYNAGVLTSNMSLDDVTVLGHVLSGLRFTNLTFSGGANPLNIRAALWQSKITNCSFYYCQMPIQAKQCFYMEYNGITIRGDHATLPHLPALRLLRASNRITINNFSSCDREHTIEIGEAGLANASAQIALTNSSIESSVNGVKFIGTVYNFTAKELYIEEVSSVFFDTDGELKYNFDISNCYCCSSAYWVDLSGLRDSFIGKIRDFKIPLTKSIVRLRQDTYGNAAIVEISNLLDPISETGARYQLSPGVLMRGAYSEYTSGTTGTVISMDKTAPAAGLWPTAAGTSQIAIHDEGFYGKTTNEVVGTYSNAISPTAGTEVFCDTKMHFDEYTALNYSIKITPNAGSGAGGTTPSPIYLKGIVIGSDASQIVAGGRTCYVDSGLPYNTFRLHFTGFGSSSSDPAYAWMRNGLFASEGIIKLIA